MKNKQDEKLIFVTVGESKKPTHVKLEVNKINELKNELSKNPFLTVWVDPIGFHGSKAYKDNSFNALKNIVINKLLIQGSSKQFTNFDGLYSQSSLIELDVCDINDVKFDFSYFDKLEDLACIWCNGMVGIFNRNFLQKLAIWKYKSKSLNLIEFCTLFNLNYLRLVQSNIISLNGLEKLNKLRNIELAYNSNLEIKIESDIFLPKVEILLIENCKKVDFEFIKLFPNLRVLTLIKQNDIHSIKPILDGLKKLEELIILQTKILESDNRYWKEYKNIKKIVFNDMKHHLLKSIDFE